MKGVKAYRGVGAGHARPASFAVIAALPLVRRGGIYLSRARFLCCGFFLLLCREGVLTPPRDSRKTLVGASIARPCPFALQESRPGKCVAAAGWRATNGRPYTRNKAGMQFFDGLRSGQDRSLQLTRQRCGGYNKVGGNKKSHHGRWWDRQSVSIRQPR